MACYQFSLHQIHSLWRSVNNGFARNFSTTQKLSIGFRNSHKPNFVPSSTLLLKKVNSWISFVGFFLCLEISIQFLWVLIFFGYQGYCSGVAHAATAQSNVISSSESVKALRQDALERAANVNNDRVMLIDGTSIIYRAYYKLLGNLLLSCLLALCEKWCLLIQQAAKITLIVAYFMSVLSLSFCLLWYHPWIIIPFSFENSKVAPWLFDARRWQWRLGANYIHSSISCKSYLHLGSWSLFN